ncbi:MAG: BamA/TamA family outer membrane protein [Acidobacteria bacterium]|nr:BamA/TamA family outer membrane protein [Acidobacteriota bacterium]
MFLSGICVAREARLFVPWLVCVDVIGGDLMRKENIRSVANWPPARLWLLILALSWPSLLHAQDQDAPTAGRAEMLAAERDAKTSAITPPSRSAVERALYWYDNQYVLAKIFGGWNGVHLAGGDFPAGAGMKYGVGYSHVFGPRLDPHRPNRVDINAVAANSTRGYVRAAASVGFHDIGGSALDVTLRGQYYRFPQEDFFGLGQDSRREDRTDYLQEGTDVGAEARWNPVKFVEFGGGVSFLSPRIGAGTDSRFPSTDALFNPATLPGYHEQPDFLRSDASVAFDWRDNPRHPHAGGRYAVQFSNFDDRDLSAFGFRRTSIDLQQYVPLPNQYRTLAFRAAAVMTDPHAGQQVPFYFQPTLGGSQELRGFREFRFRDRNSLLMSAEYRWEASWMLDGALFVDAGKVAFDRKDLNLRNLDVSYGVGLRVHSNSAFVARLDLAFSREGFIPLLRFEHVF